MTINIHWLDCSCSHKLHCCVIDFLGFVLGEWPSLHLKLAFYQHDLLSYDIILPFRKFAVTKENAVLVFHAPGRTKEFNPFVLYRSFYGAYDETVCLDWTTDSRLGLLHGMLVNILDLTINLNFFKFLNFLKGLEYNE